jgi:hypothetical protein
MARTVDIVTAVATIFAAVALAVRSIVALRKRRARRP